MRRVSGLVLAGAIALGIGYFALATGQHARFDLPVPGKGAITYDCTLTSTIQEAQSRAKSAHAAYLTQVESLATDVAEALQAGMLKANTTGDTSGIQAASADYKARVKALRANLRQEFGCEVDSTLKDQPPATP